MFKSIRVRNFKSFEDSGEVRLAPLTLILGVNSGGKSSLLQPLLVLGQSVQQGERAYSRYAPLITNGSFVQLGDYREFVRGHDIRRKNLWDLTVTADSSDLYRTPGMRARRRTELRRRPSDVHYQIRVAATNHGEDVVVGSAQIELPDHGASFRREGNEATWRLGNQTVSQAKQDQGRLPPNDIWVGYPRLWTQEDPESKELALARELYDFGTGALMQHCRLLRHAPPYREVPQRVYMASPAAASEDLASQARRLLRRPEPSSFVKRWLAEFGVARDIDTNRLVEGLLILRLTDATTAVRSNLADFGFGTSQLLPLLIDLSEAAAPSRRAMPTAHVIQQPEVHLHPAAQSVLGDLFIEVVEQRRQLLVETHSEHLIYRVQRLVAEGRIAHEDVAIHYVDKGQAGSRVVPVELAKNGTFIVEGGLPSGFLDTGINESLEFQKALRGPQND